MPTEPPLTAYERWMVQSNLDTIRSTDITVSEQAEILRANGYFRVAKALCELADEEN
jgi:hypothetical protein